MVYYKFTKAPMVPIIPAYLSPLDAEPAEDMVLSDDYILTSFDMFEMNDQMWVYDEDRDVYYPAYSSIGPHFGKEFVYGAIVSGDCAAGLEVYDGTTEESKVIYTADAYDTIWSEMSFVTKEDQIWAKVVTSTYPARSGFVHYKEDYKENLNLLLVDLPFEDVLTDGAVDQAKIQAIKMERPEDGAKPPCFDELANESELEEQPQVMSLRSARMMTARAMSIEPETEEMISTEPLVSSAPQVRTMSLTSKARATTTTTTVTSPKEANATTKATVPTTDNVTKESDTNPMKMSGKRFIKAVQQNAKKIVQNKKKWPPVKSKGSTYTYDYSYHKSIDLSDLHDAMYNDIKTPYSAYTYTARKYNRFKQPLADNSLTRGFMHIFFVRPDCNFPLGNSGDAYSDAIKSNAGYRYVAGRRPDIIKQLMRNPNGYDGEFMNLTSNEVKGFTPIDASITTDTYGKTRGGYSVAFGRIYESGLGGTFNLTYTDNRELDIIELHRIWIDYINNVYHGVWSPKLKYQNGKILDYATAMYVIITAEDFETIIHWTKYYGVFPINVPYSALSWQYGAPITNPDLSITYQYAWCRMKDPASLVEFNNNAFGNKTITSCSYVDTYNKKKGHLGKTWVSKPFIELTTDHKNKIVYKLRFKK